MLRVAVGCPIHSRAWILPEYIEHVRAAFQVAGLIPIWIFNVGTDHNGTDDGTRKMVSELFRDEPGMWTEACEPDLSTTRTQWNGPRYEQMVIYRNKLLDMVQVIKPDYFLSLDSDILIHPSALTCLLETIEHPHMIYGYETMYAAVGGKAFLSESNTHITTYATLGTGVAGGGLRRTDADGVFPVQIIMAIKLMGPEAYNIPYAYSQWGEDIGWSLNCNKAGLQLGWDGRTVSKHIMNKANLYQIDTRVGW